MSEPFTTTPKQPLLANAGPLSKGAFVLGALSALNYVLGTALLSWVLPGNTVAIAIATVFQYLLPIAGIVVGTLARRREGPHRAAKIGLLLSYLCLAAAAFLLIIEVYGALAA
ncbi:hypothetical protein FHX49_001248 [Microbacterium endophyticum]|uniref:DUF4190 domain-containing protein n=1 Tax=Microbacterium endophyticum TaxID=1526412 RepID=A0A7W4YN24_9MICO|nr:hypothetical protein [Microbacterium endophyticum]MBB2975682.1 hypothetical protein [Microbacterium endophyticum]NIK35299.1 hypothetical protein [Microbacterium endophyticum]